MKCASVSVGIARYSQPHYNASTLRLKYAASDARAFHHYASTAWDDRQSVHLLYTDRHASIASVRGALNRIRNAGSFDVFVLYLSGHGELDTDRQRGWFCLADARTGISSLDGPTLDEMLAGIDADTTLFFLDCCHAEAITSGMEFFAKLRSGQRARVFVASSRTNQQSWETDRLKRSVFSDVLLRALSNSSDIADANGWVDLEASLLPRLREQVPLNTLADTRAAGQDPVAGGVCVSATKLPTVTADSFGRPPTVADTVRRRVRGAMKGLMMGLVATLVALDVMCFHLIATGSGEIAIRPGLRETYSLMPFHLGRELDSGFTLQDVDPEQIDLLRNLRSGSIWGFWSHRDQYGLTPWLQEVQPGMVGARNFFVSAMANGVVSQRDDPSPPLHEAVFLAELQGMPIADVASAIYSGLNGISDAVNCMPGTMDFELLSADTQVFGQDMAWLAITASKAPVQRADVVGQLVVRAAHRAGHENSAVVAEQDYRHFASAIHALAGAGALRENAVSSAFLTESRERLVDLERGWCTSHSILAQALVLGGGRERGRAEAYFVNRMKLGYADDLDYKLGEVLKRTSKVALEELALAGPLGDDALIELEALARDRWRAAGVDVDFSLADEATGTLKAISRTQSLGSELTRDAVGRMEEAPVGEWDMAPLAAFSVLAGNACADRDVYERAREWASGQMQIQAGMSDFQEGLGHLLRCGQGGSWREEQAGLLGGRLSPGTRLVPPTVGYRGEIVVASWGDEIAVALGRALQGNVKLPSETLAVLVDIAVGRSEMEDRAQILRGLGNLWFRDLEPRELASTIRQRAIATRRDARRRRLESEVAAVYVAGLEERMRVGTIARLLDEWQVSSDPELRIALAETVSLTGMALLGAAEMEY